MLQPIHIQPAWEDEEAERAVIPTTVCGAQGTNTLIPEVHRALDCFHIDKRVQLQASYAMPSTVTLLSFWLYIYNVVLTVLCFLGV